MRHIDERSKVGGMTGLKAIFIRFFQLVIGFGEQPTNQIPDYFFSVGFPNVNAGGPNPNAAGVAPFCPDPDAPKLNGDLAPPPVDGKWVTGVNTNAEGLEPVVPFVVVEGNVGLFIVGAGVDCAVVVFVPNALTGVDVVPNTLPFASGLGPGLEASCLGAANGCAPVEVPGVVEVEDGKAVHESDPPAGLFAAKLNGG
jgi:hypothetical protein